MQAQEITSHQDRYAARLSEERKVNLYYIPINMKDGSKHYAYVAASALLHDQFIAAIEMNQVPDFSVIVERGQGEPTLEVKQRMKEFYGFVHSDDSDNDNILPPKESLN